MERIDGDLEAEEVHLVKLSDDGSFAEKHNIQVVPSIIFFKEQQPMVFPGDVSAEQRVLKWVKQIVEQFEEDEEEEEDSVEVYE